MNIEPTINPINKQNFQVNRGPNISKNETLALFPNKNTAPSKVPIGQTYLQNAGTVLLEAKPNIKGTHITSTTNNTYLKYDNTLVILFFFSFGVLILYNSSWKKPPGQNHPQIILPKEIAYNNKIPTTYVIVL